MGGFNFVRLRYLGAKYVLLSSDVEGYVEKLMEENKEWLDDISASIVPWSESFEVADKLLWVYCREIPSNFWSNQCFELVGSLVGTFIEVYEATTSWEVLEFSRLRIRMLLRALTNLIKVVSINDVLCKMFFEEESYAKVTQVGCSHGRWGGASEGNSEAWVDGSIEDDFYVLDGSNVGSDTGAKGGEEVSAQFPVTVGGSARDGACMGDFKGD